MKVKDLQVSTPTGEAGHLLRESQHQSLAGVLGLSSAMQALAHQSRDHREALDAFMEKRPGTYTGE